MPETSKYLNAMHLSISICNCC